MSTILWSGDRLFQRVGDNVAELGYVQEDEDTGTCVLWLRDLRGVFGVGGGYVSGDSFASMKEAQQRAAGSLSAQQFHLMWLNSLHDSGQPSPDRGWFDMDWAPFIRLFNHVREQWPGWVEQAADWLSNLPGFFRGNGPVTPPLDTTATLQGGLVGQLPTHIFPCRQAESPVPGIRGRVKRSCRKAVILRTGSAAAGRGIVGTRPPA